MDEATEQRIAALESELQQVRAELESLRSDAEPLTRLVVKAPLALNRNMLSIQGSVGGTAATGGGVDVQVTGFLNGQRAAGTAPFTVAPVPLP